MREKIPQLRAANPNLNENELFKKAEVEYRKSLVGGDEFGSVAVFDHFYPIIDNMAKLKVSNPDSHQANINRLKDEYPWLPTAYYE